MTPEELKQKALWDARDRRYAMLRNDLTDGMIAAVRIWRMREAVSPSMRNIARVWAPPPRSLSSHG